MTQLGMCTLLGLLEGNESTVRAIQASLGKVITGVTLFNNTLTLAFADDTTLAMFDAGQSCCESRYMTTDDDLSGFIGATLVNVELADAPPPQATENNWDEHDVQFLRILTDQGVLVMANHNEHNGYYGGFALEATQGAVPGENKEAA
jgi:hypothetical protein